MLPLKVTKNQSYTLSLENTISEKPQGLRVKVCSSALYALLFFHERVIPWFNVSFLFRNTHVKWSSTSSRVVSSIVLRRVVSSVVLRRVVSSIAYYSLNKQNNQKTTQHKKIRKSLKMSTSYNLFPGLVWYFKIITGKTHIQWKFKGLRKVWTWTFGQLSIRSSYT